MAAMTPMYRFSLSTAVVTVLFAQQMSPGFAAGLMPHRAVYDLAAKRIDRNSGITALTGRLAYEITGSACDGWSTTYRIANRFVKTEGQTQLTDTQLTAWEAGDGSEMRLNQKQFVDNSLNSETFINVKKPSPQEDGKGMITLPSPKEFVIPKEAVFPILYQLKLIDMANGGNSRDVSLVYEGSDGEKLFNAISFIGKKREVGNSVTGQSEEVNATLGSMPSWPMTVSYYPADDGTVEQPVYQSSFQMFENGVSTDLLFDYGTYAVKGTLTKLEFLPEEKCK